MGSGTVGVGESGFGYLRQVGLRVVDELQVGRLFTARGVKRRRSQLLGLRVVGELQAWRASMQSLMRRMTLPCSRRSKKSSFSPAHS